MISLKITRMGSKGQLIDVRQPEEFELGHIKMLYYIQLKI